MPKFLAPKRSISVHGEIAFIHLTQGKFAVIDAADIDLVSGYTWRAQRSRQTFYASTSRTMNGKKVGIHLHRLITGCSPDLVPDHRDGDGLNNLRSNLRIVTNAQNASNRRLYANNQTGVKGVQPYKNGRWRSQIRHQGKLYHLGVFDSRDDAARAYATASAELHGEFGRVVSSLPGLFQGAK